MWPNVVVEVCENVDFLFYEDSVRVACSPYIES